MSNPKFYTSKHGEEDVQRLVDGPERSCNSCSHAATCVYIRGAVRLIKMEEGGEGMARPFDPEDIAKICKFYTFKTSVQEITR